MAATPALFEAQRGHIECDVNVDFLAYWNDPQGVYDRTFVSPFADDGSAGQSEKYVTFESDSGGWNNIRMAMEIVVVFTLATGRTLVMPPDQPLYLLWKDTKKKHRNVGDFYPLDKWRQKLKVISTEEFLRREGGPNGRMPINDTIKERVLAANEVCEFRHKSDRSCFPLYDHLRAVGFVPKYDPDVTCLIFDRDYMAGEKLDEETKLVVKKFCNNRKQMYYDKAWQDLPLIHFAASHIGAPGEYRLLSHFYSAVIFTNSAIDNYFKRFVRDIMRYKDEIYCAAGKVVRSIQKEGKEKGFKRDSEGGGCYSSLHIRRGELQYESVKISAEQWLNNTKELWQPNEILFIATDEKNKTFFEPMAKDHQLRFLDDYWDVANLGNVDPNFLGMIDTIVASKGRVFVGTAFSTFSGYINRIRGYHGISMKNSFYGTLDYKCQMHGWAEPKGQGFSREFPVGWVGIDGDEWVKGERNQSEEKSMSDLNNSKSLQLEEKPALVGAKRGHVQCDLDVDDLVYWNDPQGQSDVSFRPPFASNTKRRQYITFEPDNGGWNNIRMSLEIFFVIAAATGRTLVMPPDAPLYLLNKDPSKKERGFADFFPIHTSNFNQKVPVISMEELLRLEGGPGGAIPIPVDKKEALLKVQKQCRPRKADPLYCGTLFDFLRESGMVPNLDSNTCLIFDEQVFQGGSLSDDSKIHVQKICQNRTSLSYYDSTYSDALLLHFDSKNRNHRLLLHFYTFIVFTNPKYDNFYKRFVRDFVHYLDPIFCAAGKIIHALQEMGKQNGHSEGYSSMHVRRGDLQYKSVKISASEWYSNLHEIWNPDELIYIATDERNKTFFDPIAVHHQLKFLDDFKDLAKLGDLDPNYMGMIDTIVASKGRVFAGTYWSTFSGYINRLRGYYGMSMKNSYYGDTVHKNVMHVWDGNLKMGWNQEFPDGWVGIDGDKWPPKDIF